MSPEDILAAALAKGVGLLAIADHDILGGSLELQGLCSKCNIQYVPAVELDALDNGNNIHILGYGMNLLDKEFCLFVERNRTLLDDMSIKLIVKMQADYKSITLSDYLEYSYDREKGGWKALHYLCKKGLSKSLKEGIKFYQTYKCSYDCVDFPSVGLAAQHIHNAGGKAILAHPGEVIKETDINLFTKEVLRLISYGLDGIECYYPSHTNDITDVCLEICKDRDLLITAGSDCHGDFGSSEVGEMDIALGQLKLGNILSNL
jgi:predicted metal-dependent phosphoesterase TrpH